MGRNQIIHILNIEQFLRLYITLPYVIRINSVEVGLPDFKTGLLTYVLLKGDIGRVMVFTGGGGFHFIEVKKAILYRQKDIDFANESWRSNQGVVNGRVNRGFLKCGL